MKFQEAVKTCLTKYADVKGVASRSEYWYFTLFQIAILIPAYIVSDILYAIVALGLMVPALAAAVRRLHDTGRSGWIYLLVFIPIVGGIIVTVMLCQQTKEPYQS
jgi:uncharacterized membrane protein YhaH (DUF805 family)